MLETLQSVNSLVVRCPNWVGDIVMATPHFEALRNNFPNAHISALIRPYARGIVAHSPWFDRIVDCDDKSLRGISRIRQALRDPMPDAGILFPNTTHSFITFKLTGIEKVFGYRRNLRRFFLTDGPIPILEGGKYKPLPMQDYYSELLRHLGLELPEGLKPSLHLDSSLESWGENQLQRYEIEPNDTLIGLNPGASFGSSKCWPIAYFARLAELLQQEWQCKLILLVGPGEEGIAARIVEQSQARIIDTAADKIDLDQLKPLVRRCNLLITNDTGPRHYAVAFDVPNIVLMGPTNRAWTDSNLERTTIMRKDLPCSPCHKKVCPYDHHACMNDITPEMVFETAQTRLGGN